MQKNSSKCLKDVEMFKNIIRAEMSMKYASDVE